MAAPDFGTPAGQLESFHRVPPLGALCLTELSQGPMWRGPVLDSMPKHRTHNLDPATWGLTEISCQSPFTYQFIGYQYSGNFSFTKILVTQNLKFVTNKSLQ